MYKVNVLNCNIDNLTFKELIKRFENGVFVSANVHMVMLMQKDPEFYRSYQCADFCINDSRIIYTVSKVLKESLRATILGSDFFPAFYQYHQENQDVTIFLLGAKDGVAKKAQRKINEKIGRKIVTGEYSPPFGFEKDPDECQKIVKIINDSRASVLVVGLSAPKGEKWVYQNRKNLTNIRYYFCIGAAIDFEAGNIPRAPVLMRKIGLEWLFRILTEPRRLWKRYLVEDISFFWLFAKQLLGIYKNPFEAL